MPIKERVVEDVLILDVSGKIQLGEGDGQLIKHVNGLIERGQRKMILNLAEVTYVDSSGLGEVIRSFAAMKRAGGELKLANLTRRLIDLLTITKLSTFVEINLTEQDALNLLNQPKESSSPA